MLCVKLGPLSRDPKHDSEVNICWLVLLFSIISQICQSFPEQLVGFLVLRLVIVVYWLKFSVATII